jgi:hypothetical protein
MITINNLEEMKKYYDKQTNTYVFYDDVEFNINIDVESDINAFNIKARNINARDINACNIKARNINAWDINAQNIKAWDINAYDIDAKNIEAWNINARDINACNIKALDINACNIKANDIDYYSICIARDSFKCKSVNGYRKNSIHKCLDKEIEYIK